MHNKHSEHLIRENSLLDPVVLPPPAPPNENLFKMDVIVQGVVIPSEVTTYWCQVMKLDKRLVRQKHHAIEFSAIVTPGNEHLVHHMELFHCRENPGESYNGPCDNQEKPEKAKSCSKVLSAWAMGAEPVVYPKGGVKSVFLYY
jgi:dopamine beta-monooxygenase